MNLVEKIRKATDVRHLLDRYGAQRISGSTHLRSTCPIHGGDNPSALVFDVKDKLWYCHTGCGRGGDIFDFVALMEGVQFKEAVEIVAEMYEIEVDWTQEDFDEDYFKEEAKSFIEWMKKRESDNDLLPLFQLHDEVLNVNKFRGFSKEVIDHYGLQVTLTGELHDRLVLPLEDKIGRTVGYSGRRIKADMKAKWMHKPNGLQLGHIIPGIGLNLEYITNKMELIIVEGPFDAMRLWDRGYKNVAQIMSANITDEQVREVQSVSFSVVLGYDNDMAGRNATRKAIDKLSFSCDIRILNMPDGMDPCDLSEEETKFAYENRLKPYEFFDMYGQTKEKRSR